MILVTDSINPDQSSKGPRIRVIGAGLPRCATSSLRAALEMPNVGYFPCMHMAHVTPHSSRSQMIVDAMLEEDRHNRRKLLHKIFDGYEATTDFPGCWFIDDLMDMYPDAPLILNQRHGGGAAWFKSFQGSLGFFQTWTYYLLCFPIKSDRLHWTMHQIARRRSVEKFGVGLSPEFYDVYQDFVQLEAEKRGRRVLIWRAGDGWGPLCQFLDKEVPKDEPFPWVNDSATMTTVKKVLMMRGILSWAAILGGAYTAWRYGPQLAGVLSSKMGHMLGNTARFS
ncbi:Uncharacterized protein TCAP_03670 [Tolypocladium capitatum]|uniref:NAD dependent epimerase/dehydratase n=1 Tax=Tolypocladium capitatum TaxID=45235 RepID=A0A2K3QFS5_9HYPO|nr:Uncharacterized protein TCAP_03670 [Tolypocladium capitatum]